MSVSAATQDQDVKNFSLAREAEAISDVDRPVIFGECTWSGPVMFGVARLPKSTVEGLWEQHDHGDEFLVVIAGNFTLRLQLPDGAVAERDAAPGDMVVVPKGYPHSFRVHSAELQVLFVTPKEGNHGWSEQGGKVVRHG